VPARHVRKSAQLHDVHGRVRHSLPEPRRKIAYVRVCVYTRVRLCACMGVCMGVGVGVAVRLQLIATHVDMRHGRQRATSPCNHVQDRRCAMIVLISASFAQPIVIYV
jgi:hypothetical protein